MTTIKFETLGTGYSVISDTELTTNKSIRFFAKIKNEFHYIVSTAAMNKLKKQYNCILKTIDNY